jgi:predicted  nucleic acid-binding Zn-ribbon protein
MNPLDALIAPPALLKRALDDLHDIAELARRYTALEENLDARVERIEGDIARMREGVDGLRAALAPISNLEPIRRGIEPLERSMTAVRDSVDELEPMIADLDARIRRIEPKLDEMGESIEPIGDLAEKIPGNRRRRSD